MIQIKNLEFHYRSEEFHLTINDFSVSRFEKAAVIGPSGSGKTTLLNLIAAIIAPVKGDIYVNDILLNGLNDAQRRNFRITNIGFVFQDFQLLDYLNVLDNILHPYRISPALKLTSEVRKRAVKLANQMGIDDKLKRSPEDLSHGEKQRAAICRALLPQPKIILADEATGNLDPKNKARIIDLLFKSIEDNEATLLAVTHDHELLSRFDRVVDFEDFQAGQHNDS